MSTWICPKCGPRLPHESCFCQPTAQCRNLSPACLLESGRVSMLCELEEGHLGNCEARLSGNQTASWTHDQCRTPHCPRIPKLGDAYCKQCITERMSRNLGGLLDEAAKRIGPKLVRSIATSCASFIAAIDSDSSKVASYLEQRLQPLATFANSDIRVRNAMQRIATDARQLCGGDHKEKPMPSEKTTPVDND